MKKAIFLGILVAVLFGLGQDQGRAMDREEKKHQGKLEKLQKKLEKERLERRRKYEKLAIEAKIVNERLEERQPGWKGELSLVCPNNVGYDDVWISPDLGRDIPYMKYGSQKEIFARAVGVIRVKNSYTNMTLNIFEDKNLVVRNLCPGGSITLTKSMDPNLFRYSSWERYHWIAEGMVDGRLAWGYITPMPLDAWQGLYEKQKKDTPWLIKLDRVDREF